MSETTTTRPERAHRESSGAVLVVPSAPGTHDEHGFRAAWRRRRARLDDHPRLRLLYKVLVAVAGVLVVAVGLVLVPLPGPGWLIVFLGVALLGTEFPAAHRVTAFVRRQLHRARVWWRARRARPRRAPAARGL